MAKNYTKNYTKNYNRNKKHDLNIAGELLELFLSRIYILMYAVILIIWNMQFGHEVLGELAGAAAIGLVPSVVFYQSLRQALVSGITFRRKRGQHGENRGSLKISACFSFIISVIYLGILFLWGNNIINLLFHREIGKMTVLLMGVLSMILLFSACLEGFFKGYGVKGASERGRILKSVIVFISSCVSGNILQSYGDKVAALKRSSELAGFYGAMGITIGIIAGSLIVLIYYYIFYRILLQANAGMFKTRYGHTPMIIPFLREMGSGIPASVGRYGVFPADFAVISLVASGDVVQDLGKWITIGLLPVFTTMSVMKFFWPDHMNSCVYSYAHQEYDTLADRLGGTIHSIIAGTIPVVAVMMVLSDVMIAAFFPAESTTDAGIMRVSLVIITFGMALQTAFRFLQGTRQKKNMTAAFFVWLFQIVVCIAASRKDPLHPEMGLAWGMVVYVCVLGIVYWLQIFRSFRIHTDVVSLLGMPFVGGLVAGFLTFIIRTVAGGAVSGIPLIVLCAIPSLLAYFTGLLMLRGVRRGELKYFMFGGILRRFGEMMGVFR